MSYAYFIIVDKNNVIKHVQENIYDREFSRKKAIDVLNENIEFKAKNDELFELVHKTTTFNEKEKLTGYELVKAKSRIQVLKKEIQDSIDIAIQENLTFMNIPIGSIGIDQERFELLKGKIDQLSDNESVLNNQNADIVKNLIGKKYWIKENDIYTEFTIDELNVDYPIDCILPENLTTEDRENIIKQNVSDEDLDQELYQKKFSEFLTRIFLDSDEYQEFNDEKKIKD